MTAAAAATMASTNRPTRASPVGDVAASTAHAAPAITATAAACARRHAQPRQGLPAPPQAVEPSSQRLVSAHATVSSRGADSSRRLPAIASHTSSAATPISTNHHKLWPASRSRADRRRAAPLGLDLPDRGDDRLRLHARGARFPQVDVDRHRPRRIAGPDDAGPAARRVRRVGDDAARTAAPGTSVRPGSAASRARTARTSPDGRRCSRRSRPRSRAPTRTRRCGRCPPAARPAPARPLVKRATTRPPGPGTTRSARVKRARPRPAGRVAEGGEDRMPRVDRRQRGRERARVGRLDAQARVADDLAERAGVERLARQQPQRAAAARVVVQHRAASRGSGRACRSPRSPGGPAPSPRRARGARRRPASRRRSRGPARPIRSPRAAGTDRRPRPARRGARPSAAAARRAPDSACRRPGCRRCR